MIKVLKIPVKIIDSEIKYAEDIYNARLTSTLEFLKSNKSSPVLDNMLASKIGFTYPEKEADYFLYLLHHITLQPVIYHLSDNYDHYIENKHEIEQNISATDILTMVFSRMYFSGFSIRFEVENKQTGEKLYYHELATNCYNLYEPFKKVEIHTSPSNIPKEIINSIKVIYSCIKSGMPIPSALSSKMISNIPAYEPSLIIEGQDITYYSMMLVNVTNIKNSSSQVTNISFNKAILKDTLECNKDIPIFTFKVIDFIELKQKTYVIIEVTKVIVDSSDVKPKMRLIITEDMLIKQHEANFGANSLLPKKELEINENLKTKDIW